MLTKQVDAENPEAFVWTKKDDEILRHHVSVHGTKHWKLATKSLPKWLGWECRRRYNEYIRTNRESWTQEEDQHLLRLYEEHGSRWSQIARNMENNRSYELVKRRYGQLYYNLNKRAHTSLEIGKISKETSIELPATLGAAELDLPPFQNDSSDSTSAELSSPQPKQQSCQETTTSGSSTPTHRTS